MELNLRGKSVLITGGSKGIGLGIARRMVAEGCSTIRLVARHTAGLEAARDILRRDGAERVDIIAADLGARGSAETVLTGGAVDILVNNAGAIPSGNIHSVDEDTWREAWDLKVFGYINMCRLAYRQMKDAGQGTIINIIGAAGSHPEWGYIAGGTANASLMALTRALGASSLAAGIRVNGINPGLILTDRLESQMRRRAKAAGNEEAWTTLLERGWPPGRVEHIADMTAFLASDLSSFTSGTIIDIDGGYAARGHNRPPR